MNQRTLRSIGRWISMVCASAALAACGGGGGGVDAPADTQVLPQADARSGNYTLMAVNGKEYTLALDFDASSWHVTGNGVDSSGAFIASGSEFQFQPGNSVGTAGTTTTRFTLADADTVVGEVPLAEGALPFIAGRSFEDSIAGAVGRFNLFGRTLNADGSLDNTAIQQGEITADGHLRTCEDNRILEIANCPSTSVVSGTLTVAGALFTSHTDAGDIRFRVAKVGGEKLFVRASPTASGATRFMLGTPATTGFAGASFVGGTSEPAWGTIALASASPATSFGFTVTGTSPDGTTTVRTGTATPGGAPGSSTLASLLVATTTDAGNFFVMRSAGVGAVIAARSSTLAPGFIAIGKRQ